MEAIFMTTFSREYIEQVKQTLDIFPHEQFEALVNVLVTALRNKRNIFVMGNGGSGATASHWVCDMNKGCGYGREQRFRMMCLNDNIPTLLAYANDVGYEDIFVEQLKNFLEEGDVVIAISGSGNSKNVVKAIEYANSKGAITVGLVGYSGGKLLNLVQIPLHIPVNDMQIAEDIHMMVVHMTMRRLLQEFESGGLRPEKSQG
jgi:D-sedoheptulose 7-phosphate isomerase